MNGMHSELGKFWKERVEIERKYVYSELLLRETEEKYENPLPG
jgi:hypothetical protein